MTNTENRRWSSMLLGAVTAMAGMGATTMSCGTVQNACASDCPDTSALEEQMAVLEQRLVAAEAKLAEPAMAELPACADGQTVRWNATDTTWACVELTKPLWSARIARSSAGLEIRYPDGSMQTLPVGDGATALTGSHIAYRPGTNGSDAQVFFRIENAPTIKCGLFAEDNDYVRPGVWTATDSGNQHTPIWGNSTTHTFVFQRVGSPLFGIENGEAFVIVCLP